MRRRIFARALASANWQRRGNASQTAKIARQMAIFATLTVIAACAFGTLARSQNLTAKEEQPDGLDAALRAGDQARIAGDLSSAEVFYKQATIISPRSADTWLRLGEVQLRSNELYVAAQSYRAAQAVDETNLDAAFALGQIAVRLGNPRAAVEEFEFGLKSHPDNVQLHFATAVAYAAQRKFANALEHYRRALDLDPQNVLIRADYGLLQLQTGNPEGAQETLEPFAKSPLLTDRARLVLALSYMALGKSSEALSIAPARSESELRQLLSEQFPQIPPNRGEQQLESPNHLNKALVGERSPKAETPETRTAESSGGAANSTYPQPGLSVTPRASETGQYQETSQPPGYRLQLGALRSEEGAREHLNQLRDQYSDILSDVSLTVIRAELGKKGTFYRVQAGPVGDLKAAEARCAQLKKRQVDCFVVAPK